MSEWSILPLEIDQTTGLFFKYLDESVLIFVILNDFYYAYFQVPALYGCLCVCVCVITWQKTDQTGGPEAFFFGLIV